MSGLVELTLQADTDRSRSIAGPFEYTDHVTEFREVRKKREALGLKPVAAIRGVGYRAQSRAQLKHNISMGIEDISWNDVATWRNEWSATNGDLYGLLSAV